VTTSAVIILTGLVVILGRYWLENKRPTRQSVKGPGEPSTSDGTLVRSWIAIVLVGGLLVFCAVSLSIGNTSLQSTLFGGLVSSVGAAIAFYFSSKSAEQARQDVLTATQSATEVPNLQGMTVTDARVVTAKTPLQFVLSNTSALPGDSVTHQSPSAGTSVLSGSKVFVDT
jgi:ABC-type Fe3+ transport system permease subunit